jgi:2-polyprenyl-3-methyl-5-hydroxy-6-metoxy-1,4-benzoquinol methylase
MKDDESRSADAHVAEEVRAFYEQHPYPPPVVSLDEYRRRWQSPERRRADYHLSWPARLYAEEFSILVAGCGTSQAAKHAVRWPHARVTGIDFSATSVRCTLELKQRYGLKNLEVRELPVERAAELGTGFDQIVCTGVLHHLADPDAGLRALRSVLNPEGAMHLMVYAPYGRGGIYMLQQFAARLGICANEEGIRDLIAALQALPSGHPLESLLREAPDFRDEAALADALLHPRDRAYSVPQFFDFLKDASLTFGRWVRQAPYSPHAGVLARIPQASRIASLTAPEQFAVAELFRGTMLRHSAIAYRDDYPRGAQQPVFAGDGWLDYVPIRMPDTICVQERLPPGASAVLINQTHTFRDLYLPITRAEKRLLDAIDGKRSIGDLVERALPSSSRAPSLDAARNFFERLWHYDQVVFDVSQARETLAT